VTFLTEASEAEVLRAQLTAELADRRQARHILDRPTVAERADAAEARELLEVWRSTMVEPENQKFTDADLTPRHIDPSAYRVQETPEEFPGAGLRTGGHLVRVLEELDDGKGWG
jgi:hypothetical protein